MAIGERDRAGGGMGWDAGADERKQVREDGKRLSSSGCSFLQMYRRDVDGPLSGGRCRRGRRGRLQPTFHVSGFCQLVAGVLRAGAA